MSSEPFYREYLRIEFSRRSNANSRYSLRSFARTLNLDPGSLSQVLSGKRTISTTVANRILARLETSPSDRERFLQSILGEKTTLGVSKIAKSLRISARSVDDGRDAREGEELLDSARFAVISDWYHYAIMEMTCKSHFQLEPDWISERLGISENEAKLAIHRLLSLGLIERFRGRWRKSRTIVDTKDKTKTSRLHQERVKQVLAKSLFSLENHPIAIRNHTATTLCVDPARIPEAKARVQKFIWELTDFLGGNNPEHVYEIAIQFFPLERIVGKVDQSKVEKESA